MLKTFSILLTAVLVGCAFAGERTVYRDGSGRMAGSATKEGSRVVYRDASGRITGSAAPQGSRA